MGALLARWMPENASAHGANLDYLNSLVHWLMALLFVGWGLYFVYVLFRFRSGRQERADYRGARSHFSTYVEGGVVLVEAVLLVGFAIPAWARWVTPHSPDAEHLEVRVVAQQFAWNVHYPGPDGRFGATAAELVDEATNPIGLDPDDPAGADDVLSINQLHLPVARPVTVRLSSKDVIHSFFLPPMRVKQDAIPGMEIPVHFIPMETTPEANALPACVGQKSCWEIACAQLCGLSHYRMKGFLMVHEAEAFDAWLASKVEAKQAAAM